jgi:hypothetical protein
VDNLSSTHRSSVTPISEELRGLGAEAGVFDVKKAKISYDIWHADEMRGLKHIFLLVTGLSLPLAFVACSHSGVEPNWDRMSPHSPEASSYGANTEATQFRIEFRRKELDENSARSASRGVDLRRGRGGVQVTARGSAADRSEQRSSRTSSFVMGRPGQPISLQHEGQSFVVLLGYAGAGTVEVGINHVTGSPGAPDEKWQSSRISTSVVASLGRWMPLGSMTGESLDGRRRQQFGSNTRFESSGSRGSRFHEFEIRVIPLGAQRR